MLFMREPELLGVGAEDVVARTVRLKAALPFLDARSLHLAPGLLMREPRELAAAAEALISRGVTGAGSRGFHSFPDCLLIVYQFTRVPVYKCTRTHSPPMYRTHSLPIYALATSVPAYPCALCMSVPVHTRST